ncbi:MAG: DnaA/Hda family protein [Pseudomonadota bacterium]
MTKQFREYLALRCQEQDLRTWFDPLTISINEDEQCITVFFPHPFFGTWFSNGPQAVFSYAVHDFFGQNYRILYADMQKRPVAPVHAFNNAERVYIPNSTPLRVTGHPESHVDGYPEARPDNLSTPYTQLSTTVPTKDYPHDRFGHTIGKAQHEQTFDSFIVNHKNTFPLTAAREAASGAYGASNAQRYNPVLICGESGNGKSHLLGAIAHDLATAMGPASVYCKSITDIEILYARADKLVVRKHLMQREAFLLDDIHLLCDLPHLHDEFVCLFDHFLATHKQMAFACTGGLALLQDISPALRSRLELGLILHLKEPDIDVRARFIQSQCAQASLKLTREQVLLIAQRCPSFRHITGILLKISAYVEMVEHNVEDRELEKLLRHAESGRERKLSHKKIIDIVSDHFNLSPADILGDKRHKEIVFARQVAMFLCRELLGCSFPTLGRFFNGKDHSTTMYSVNKINKLQRDNKDTHTLVTELKKRCISRENDRT